MKQPKLDLFVVLASNADLLDEEFEDCYCREGWTLLLEQILEDWRLSGAPKIRSIKEKLGTLRITSVDQAHAEARRLRQVAMEWSARICEICGGPGEVNRLDGCLTTRCLEHRRGSREELE